MGDPDSLSMTPPISPLMGIAEGAELPEWQESPPKRRRADVDPEMPIVFACLGEPIALQGQRTHSIGFLQQGELERLLAKMDQRPSESTSITTELFGQIFVTELALDEMMDTLFYMWRQHFDKACNFSDSTSDGQNQVFFSHRQNMRRFFVYIREFLLRYSSTDVVSSDCFMHRLLCHLQALLLYTSQLHELPTHVISSASSKLGNQSSLASYHQFHAHLDVRWSVIEILHIISIKFPETCGSVHLYEVMGDDLCGTEIFDQLIRLTLWDVIKLALNTHTKMTVNDYRRQTPFVCTCLKEMMILLIKLLDYRKNKFAKQSFWASLYPVIQTLIASQQQQAEKSQVLEADCSQFPMPPAFACNDLVGFCWWLIFHIAPLYRYDDYGVVKTNAILTESGQNYFVVQTLLKAMLSNKLSEGALRCYLRCCLSLSQQWGPNQDVITLLWEHFYKRLNEHFRQSGMGLEGLASMCKTPSAWLEQVKQFTSGDETKLDTDSSFHLFLRLLATHLTSSPGTKSNTIWNRIKGRFYTKFHARRMQELMEVGIVNFSSLFLTIAMTTDMDDVVHRMCGLLTSPTSQDTAQRATTWRALFAAILLYVETSQDTGFIAEKLVKAFNQICNELSLAVGESSRYVELFGLVSQYLENTQEVLEMSNSLSMNQHKLLGSGVKEALKVCRENELQKILSFCQAVLSKLRMFHARSSQDSAVSNIQSTADGMWTLLLAFTKSHACTGTPPPHIADVAASFTLLSLTSAPSRETGMKEDFLSLLQYFGWNDQVNPNVSCRYLCHILPNHSAMERVSISLRNHETMLIAAWFRCCWLLPAENDQLCELTRLIMKLEMSRQMFEDTNMETAEASSAVHDFVLVLGKKHRSMKDISQKFKFQSQVKMMLGDVLKYISHALRQGAGNELQTAYLIGGLLAKHCAQLLYVKSQPDSIFPLLLERLALPRILLTPNKPLPTPMQTALRQNLYMYIQGMSHLNYRQDPYLQRKVKELVLQYLPRFPVKSSVSFSAGTVHPLVAALSESCASDPEELSVAFRHHIFVIVCGELQRTQTPITPQLGVQFFQEVLSQTKKPTVIARDGSILLSTLLELSVQKNDALAAVVLRQITLALSKDESQSFRNDVSHVIEKSIAHHMASNSMRLMKILEMVAERCMSLLTPLIPTLTGAVRSSETKRGVGLDKQLRMAYFAVLSHLGEEGRSEKSNLLSSSSDR